MKTPQHKLRVWNIINPPAAPIRFPVDSPEEGARLIEKLANQQLQHDHIFANAFGLEVFEDGDWCEWYSDEGQDIDEFVKAKGED